MNPINFYLYFMKKEMLLKILFAVFVFELIGEMVFIFFEIPIFIFLFKPLLMPLLAFWYLKNTDKPLKPLLYALGFSWGGDVALMFLPYNENFFLAGLASFLVAHLLYIYIFLKFVDRSKKLILKRRPHLVLPFVLFGLSLLAFLAREAHPDFPAMKIPIIVYASVIMLMVISAIARFERVTQNSFAWVLIGALLFMFSDTIIALNNFSLLFEDYKYAAKILIMSLYVLGQFYIVKGVLEQQKQEN